MMPGYRPAPEKGAPQIGVQHVIPFFIGHSRQERIARDSGIIDQDVDPAGLFGQLIDDLIDGLTIGDIAGAGQGGAPAGFDCLNRLREFFDAARDAGDLGTAVAQRQGNGLCPARERPR